MKQANLQGADIKRVTIRIPMQLHARLARSADAGDRSINSEILAILDAVLPKRGADRSGVLASPYRPVTGSADGEHSGGYVVKRRHRSRSLF